MAKGKKIRSKETVAAKPEAKAAVKDGDNGLLFIAGAALGALVAVVINYLRPGLLPSRALKLQQARARVAPRPAPQLLPPARPRLIEPPVKAASEYGMRGMG